MARFALVRAGRIWEGFQRKEGRMVRGRNWWLAAAAGLAAWGMAAAAMGEVLVEVASFFGVGRRVLEVRDFNGFTVSGDPEEAPERLALSGLVYHSALGVEAVKTRVEGDVLRVEVRGGLARKGVDGNLNESIALPEGVREVQFGRERAVVWNRRVAETWRKLGETVVSKVEFADAAPRDVLEYLCGLLKEATPETAIESLPETWLWREPVTLKLERAALRDVVRTVEEAVHAHVVLNGDASAWEIWEVIRLEDVAGPEEMGTAEEGKSGE